VGSPEHCLPAVFELAVAQSEKKVSPIGAYEISGAGPGLFNRSPLARPSLISIKFVSVQYRDTW